MELVIMWKMALGRVTALFCAAALVMGAACLLWERLKKRRRE